MIKARLAGGEGAGRGSANALFIGDDAAVAAADLRARYEILLRQIPSIRSLVFCDQVHGDRVLEMPGDTARLHFAGEGDALVTRERGTALLIRTADCIPILFSAFGGSLIGAVHAGWRGLEKKNSHKGRRNHPGRCWRV